MSRPKEVRIESQIESELCGIDDHKMVQLILKDKQGLLYHLFESKKGNLMHRRGGSSKCKDALSDKVRRKVVTVLEAGGSVAVKVL